MVPWKSFLGFVFEIFEKRKIFFLTILTSKGPPFGKKIENIKKNFFFDIFDFFPKGGPFDVKIVKKIFFRFSKILKTKPKNDFHGTIQT